MRLKQGKQKHGSS
ncbi:hypothetical protein CFP56_013565 [Quercus suber]|uniref:Uncharacterized protein n=1 Tax=Quercus suber TaxID=58331 RepID=A0AAW0KW98_QUESU